MGAQTKLNASYFNGSLLLAMLIGWLTQSWSAFSLALAVLLACNLYLNEIRLKRPRKPGQGKY